MLYHRFLLLKHTTLTQALHRYLSITIIYIYIYLLIFSRHRKCVDSWWRTVGSKIEDLFCRCHCTHSLSQSRDEVIAIVLTLILHHYIVQLTKHLSDENSFIVSAFNLSLFPNNRNKAVVYHLWNCSVLSVCFVFICGSIFILANLLFFMHFIAYFMLRQYNFILNICIVFSAATACTHAHWCTYVGVCFLHA